MKEGTVAKWIANLRFLCNSTKSPVIVFKKLDLFVECAQKLKDVKHFATVPSLLSHDVFLYVTRRPFSPAPPVPQELQTAWVSRPFLSALCSHNSS